MCERDERHLAVGAGSPSDPERLSGGPPPPDEVVQAVVDLLEHLVENGVVGDGDGS